MPQGMLAYNLGLKDPVSCVIIQVSISLLMCNALIWFFSKNCTPSYCWGKKSIH